VLNSSQYPDYFPQNWVLEYREDSRIAVVEYDLPAPDKLPMVESYKYIKSRDEVSEKALTQAARKKLYDSVIYQLCIRTIHELFEADVINALDAVAFNGLVTNTNPATGIEETKLIMSIVANKEQFIAFDLSQVDPKATFKHMKGVAAASLVDLTPIPPIIQLDKSDKRFISGRNVVGNLDDSVNLAAMHWDDFEHLIRELFEKEFVSSGGEVKVTQASSDGGVDAIAFDPDPIRGGKIVIQAKRYTNVVGVAAVRDLYGTVMNEGATKGILVTTSDYGKDSYEFAKDKPITLLNGSNLLSLLEKHGHKARINIAEAKKIMKV
jgi:restriction system protein